MNAATEKRGPRCKTCGDCGLIYPKPGQRGSLISLPARAMPVPCAFCDAGALECKVWRALARTGTPTPEIEIYKFRKDKG